MPHYPAHRNGSPNPYELTQGAGGQGVPGGVPNPYELTQGQPIAHVAGVPNIYELTQGAGGQGVRGGVPNPPFPVGSGPPGGNFSHLTTQGAGGGGGYTGPSLDDIQQMMNTTMGGYTTTADVENLMAGTMGGGGGYTGPSFDDIQQMMNTTMGGYTTTADVENLMAGTMGNLPPPTTGPSLDEIQQMMTSTLGSSGYMTPGDVESLMQTTLGAGGYTTPADVESLMESTLGGLEPSSAAAEVTTGDTNIDIDLGAGGAPALTQDELTTLMESTLGMTPAQFAAGGGNTADMDANGDGSITQEELEAYAGNVYQFDMPDAALTGVTDLNQMAIDYLSGTGEIPAISNFLDDLSIKHDQQAADLEQSIVNRGITDSTIADRMRYDLSRNQSNESAMMETNLMQNIVPMITQTGMGYEGITDQDRSQSLGEFFQFLDRQTAENRWTTQQQAQALSLMLNALGMSTINPSMPAFNIPAGQPGAGQSIGQLLGNLGTAYLGSGADLSWLGG